MKSILILVVAAGFAVSGCATKKYVAREVGAVNTKVENLNTELEKTQERVRNNEVALDKVNTDAQAGIGEAKSAAGEAKTTADGALTKATEAEKAAKGKLVYTVTLANDKVMFPFNRAALSPEAQAMIDEAIANVKSENKGIYIEIEGHTDSVGPEAYNQKLGEERAAAARNYLHDKHGIALARINVISYGEAKPVADNKNSAHRAENRRVVINFLE
jgi:peptidoglycan-associated lipoprotein